MPSFAMSTGRALRAALLGAALGAGATAAAAGSVTVMNADFQADAVLPGGFTSNDITDWTVETGLSSAGAGVFEPTTQFTGLALGEQVAFLRGNSSIWQAVGPVAADTDYTLSFDAGDRSDQPFAFSTARFFIGSFGGTSFDQAIAQPATDGTFAAQSFTLAAASLAAHVGQDLLIGFTTQATTGEQLIIDNVALEATAVPPVPLPASLPLMLAALGALALFRRRDV